MLCLPVLADTAWISQLAEITQFIFGRPLRKEFDGAPLILHREQFAAQLLDGKPHEELDQGVFNFFEDVGMLLRRNYLDREMVWETFGHFAKMWWSAGREYLLKEKANMGGDQVLFSGFKYLVEQIYEIDKKKNMKTRVELEPSQSEIRYFLRTEALRSPDLAKAA
jgi:hypothetical protein